MEYKYGAPDKYGDFPYLYQGKYKGEDLNDILRERLPDNYDMQIVDPIELEVLTDVVNMGIDSHLEACGMNKEARVEDRKIGDRVVQRHCALDFSKDGMICLIRRLEEYNPNDHWDFGGDINDNGESTEESEMWDAARNLRSSILETLQIENDF